MADAGRPDNARPTAQRRRETIVIALVAAVLAVVGALIGAVLLGRGGLPSHATEQGADIVTLWKWLLGLAGAITGVVLAFLFVALYQAWRYRDEGEPEQVAGSIKLELVYTAIPLAIVGLVFGLSLATEDSIEADAEPDALHVEVTAFQWGWRFDYEDGPTVIGTAPDLPELVLPLDRSVEFELHSSDVIHSFFAPAFLTKLDLIPGRTNRMVVTTDREGVYPGHCAEFCGLDHPRMNFTVRVVPQDEFDTWAEGAMAPIGGGSRRGGNGG